MKINRVPILCYHRVCPESEIGVDSRSLCVSPSQFKNQMRLLKFFGYRSITTQDLIAYLQARKNLPPRSILLTFDDGYEDNYRWAFPILKKFSFTATIFLVTDFIGNTNAWDSGTVPLLNESQIEEMMLAGIQFGSHACTHLDMSKEIGDKIKKELETSKEKLERLTSRLDIPFCYPYTRFNAAAKNAVAEAGYTCAMSGDHGAREQLEDLFNLMRIQIFPSNSLFDFWRKIQSWYPGWMSYQKQRKEK